MGDYENKNDKAPLELVDPDFIEGIAWTQQIGDERHKDNHWTDGVPVSKVLGAIKRHIAEIERGEYFDADNRGLQHAYAAACGLQYIANYVRNSERYHKFFDQQFGGPPKASGSVGRPGLSSQEFEKYLGQTDRGG